MPPAPKKPTNWRAKAEEIRRKRAMKLNPHPSIPPQTRDRFARIYSNEAGKFFATRPTPFSTSHAGAIFIYELHPQTGKEKLLGEGMILYDRENDSIVIHQARKEHEQVHVQSNRTRIRGTRGIQLFRPILDYAIESAKRLGIPKITLACNRRLMEYYSTFGFKVVGRIYEHENTSAIKGYEMELSLA
jgi:hypothetical protein